MSNIFLSPFAKLFSLVSSRYVNTFIPVKEDLTEGRTKINTKQEQEAYDNLVSTGKNIEKMLGKYPVIKELNEVLFIKVADLDDFKITGILNKGKTTASVGWDMSKKPNFVLPLYAKNLQNVYEITKDLDLSLDDIYRITRVLFTPFLNGLYRGDYSHLPKDKSYMQLDNFIQVEVKNERGIEVEGFLGPARATVVNVDGQWLIFEGWHGDPDIRYSMDIKQALEFAYLIRVKLMQADPKSSWFDLKLTVDKYNDLKKEVTVYERDWHTIEEYKNSKSE